ncbi:MAG: hypothetical protein D6753_13655 [Planctomycetota bacterium]|nr:MAG: hypothetical protein D6753_13655 [Planctomycetota bacterium]
MAWTTVLMGHPAACSGQTAEGEDAMLRTLCENGLSATAIEYVNAQLQLLPSQPLDASAADRLARWTMRLMHCHALAGLRGDASHWEQCPRIHDRFAERYPQNRRLPWVHWQLAQCMLIQTKHTYAQFLAAPGREELRSQALQLIRDLQRWVDRVRDEVQQRQPLAARQGRQDAEQAPASELDQLAADADLLQCEALLVRARLYPRGSADRIAAATEVERIAARALQQADPAWDALPALQAARAMARLEVSMPKEAARELTRLVRDLAEYPVGRQSGLALVEYLIEQGQTSRARGVWELMRQGGDSPEVAMAELLLGIGELPAEDQPDARSAAVERLVQIGKQIGERFGGYWRNRADALLFTRLGTPATASPAPTGAEFVKAQVRQLLAAGDITSAVRRLNEAAEQAWAAGDRTTGLELTTLAVALLERERRWGEVADLIDQWAARWVDLPAAAQLHVHGIVALAQELKTDPSDASTGMRYEQFLLRQMRFWPDAAATHQAQQWLRTWFEAHQRPSDYAQAVWNRAARCTEATTRSTVLLHWLAFVAGLAPEDAESVVRWVEQRSQGQGDSPHGDELQLFALLADLFVRWASSEDSQQRRSALLLRSASDRDPIHKQLLQTALVLETARQGSLPEVLRQAQGWDPASLPDELRVGLARAWIDVVSHQPPQQRSSWATALQLGTIPLQDLLASRLALRRVWAHRLGGWTSPEDFEAALQAVEAEAQKHARDGWLQLQYADMLLEQTSPDWPVAERIVKQVIASSPPASRLNFSARWQWVQILLWRDRSQDARDYARLVLASHPAVPEPWNHWLRQVAGQ